MDGLKTSLSRRAHRVLACLAVGIVLLSVFTLYGHPDFVVLLANQVWACF